MIEAKPELLALADLLGLREIVEKAEKTASVFLETKARQDRPEKPRPPSPS